MREAAPLAPAAGIARIIQSLNLPPDSLSAQLINFAKFFSLPLEPALLVRLRRNALVLRPGREAAALAAAAAAAKGVELSPEALEHYARALSPRQDRPGGGGETEGRQTGRGAFANGEGGGEQPEGGVSEETGTDGGFKQAAEILQKALERSGSARDAAFSGADAGLLALLNRIPGRDGARWMVYPFTFLAENIEIGVSVRLLFMQRSGDYAGEKPARVAVDAAVPGARNWLFVLDKPFTAAAVTRIFPDPPPEEGERRTLEREAREILGAFGGAVSVAAASTAFPDVVSDLPFPVDEAV
jgi:hypothetical protein